jgi:hypothetical protein
VNCQTCNTPAPPHELIDGLCHRCTAAALSRSQAARNANADDRDKALNERDAAIATAENFRAQGNAFRSERDSAIAAAAQMREALEAMLPILETDEADSLPCECAEREVGCKRCDYFIRKQRIVDAALGTDSGEGWKSPEEYARLEAACAEMRGALCAIKDDVFQTGKVTGRSQALGESALSSSAGTGWLSPLEAERLRAALRELHDAVAAMDTSYGTSDFLPGNKSRRFFAALEAAKATIAGAVRIGGGFDNEAGANKGQSNEK